MKVRLKDLADIQSGYPFRGAVVAGPPQCGVAVIQMRDLGEELVPDLREVVWSDRISVKPTHLVKVGDVLFRGRGNAPAGYCLRELPAQCIAAAPLLRLRLRSNVLLPEFLAWYLRQETAQAYFEGNAQGSAMRIVGVDVLENLQIPVVSREKQQKIVALVELSERERKLRQRLGELKSIYVNKVINQWLGE